MNKYAYAKVPSDIVCPPTAWYRLHYLWSLFNSRVCMWGEFSQDRADSSPRLSYLQFFPFSKHLPVVQGILGPTTLPPSCILFSAVTKCPLSCSWSYRKTVLHHGYISGLLSIVITKRLLYFIRCFYCVCWHNRVLFVFYSVHMLYSMNWFLDVKSTLHSWDKSHLVMAYNLFHMLLNSIFWCFAGFFFFWGGCVFLCPGVFFFLFFHKLEL